MSCPPEPLWVRGDTSQLCQVLLNLGVNAMQAFEGQQGQIDFTMDATMAATNGTSTPNRRVASIQVSDTGRGMDAATQARIFEPYFTTREDSRGTGLGLSMVWGIVAAHDGSLTVDSEPGRGSRIKLSLPLMSEEAATEPTALRQPLPPSVLAGAFGQGEHVLVVDDDEVVVVMLDGMLKRWGFRVTTLSDPRQAVKLVKGAPNDFDAVVTDQNMPDVSGLQLAREVLAIRRDIPVLLGSGNVDDALVDAASAVGIVAVFPKEFAVERLGTLLKSTLTRPALPAEPAGDCNPAALPPH